MNLSKVLVVFLLAFGGSLILQSCFHEAKAVDPKVEDSTNLTAKSDLTKTWSTIQQLDEIQSNQKKKVIVDVYTDWCKWCKEMDKQTFSDPVFMSYLEENYHLVKFNAETKDGIQFKDKEYSFVNGGRRGYNALAVELLDGKLSYPSFVVLDENLNTLDVTRGFKNAQQFKTYLEGI